MIHFFIRPGDGFKGERYEKSRILPTHRVYFPKFRINKKKAL